MPPVIPIVPGIQIQDTVVSVSEYTPSASPPSRRAIYTVAPNPKADATIREAEYMIDI
jgi:hypothetical protein